MITAVPGSDATSERQTASVDHLQFLRDETDRFRAAILASGPTAAVPTCPGWDAADLLWHLSVVHGFWGRIVRTRARPDQPPDTSVAARPASHEELLAAFDEAAAQLHEALSATAPEVAVWTWADDHSVAFVRRRVIQETLVHRLDAEATAKTSTPVDPALAADGVDEVLTRFLAVDLAGAAEDGPIGRLRTTDTGDAWLVRLGSGRRAGRLSDADTTGDRPGVALMAAGLPSFTVRAPAAVLDAWLWNRPTPGAVTVDGDDSAFAKLDSLVRAGIS